MTYSYQKSTLSTRSQRPPAIQTTKSRLSFSELDASNDGALMSSRSKVAASPLSKSIRQQILKTGKEMSPTLTTPTSCSTTSSSTKQTKSFRSPSPSLRTPTCSSSSKAPMSSYRTPPLSAVPLASRTNTSLRGSTAKKLLPRINSPIKPPIGTPRAPASARRQRANPVQEDSSKETRRNLDKRTVRLRFAKLFSDAIAGIPSPPVKNHSRRGGIRVFCRKRPLFDEDDFDAVRMENSNVILFRTNVQADMKTKVVQPVSLACTATFGAAVTNEHVYNVVAAPLVAEALTGKSATLLMFGPTGSGKTYSMSALQEAIGRALCHGSSVMVQCVEVVGKALRDLGSSESTLLDAHTQAKSIPVRSPEHLEVLLQVASERRATACTDRNEESSRSHAVCRLSLASGATLTLVDCAGTECRHDSLYHSKSRQQESNQINASMFALKECLRAKRDGLCIPYRSHPLTRLLQDSIELDQLSVLCTLAPNGTDFEHSHRTLQTIASLMPHSIEEWEENVVQVDVTPKMKAPKSWSHDELVDWMSEKRLNGWSPLPSHVGGREIMRMSKIQLRAVLNGNDTLAEKLYSRLRVECDLVARYELKRRIATKH